MESKGSLPFPTSGNCFYELSAQWEKHYEPIWSLAVTLCWTPLEALERLFWWTSHLFSLISHFRQIINPRGHAQVSNWERLCMPWHPRQWRASSPLYGVSHKKSCRLLGAYELTGAVPSTVNAGIFTLWSGHHFFFLTDVKTKIQSDYVTLHVESLAKARLELESNAVRLPPWLSTCHVHLSVLWARRAGFPHVLGCSLEIVAQPTFLFMKVWGLTIPLIFFSKSPVFTCCSSYLLADVSVHGLSFLPPSSRGFRSMFWNLMKLPIIQASVQKSCWCLFLLLLPWVDQTPVSSTPQISLLTTFSSSLPPLP